MGNLVAALCVILAVAASIKRDLCRWLFIEFMALATKSSQSGAVPAAAAGMRHRPVQLLRPSLACPSSQSVKLPALSFFLALRFGAAAAGAGAAASRARRSALRRSVLARSATAAVSYSDIA